MMLWYCTKSNRLESHLTAARGTSQNALEHHKSLESPHGTSSDEGDTEDGENMLQELPPAILSFLLFKTIQQPRYDFKIFQMSSMKVAEFYLILLNTVS